MSGVGVLRCGGSEVTSLDGSSTERGAVSSSTGDCSVWGRGDHGSYIQDSESGGGDFQL